MTCPTTRSGGDVSTVHAALQVSGRSWILAVGDPSDMSRAGLHGLEPHDVDGLLGRLWRAREWGCCGRAAFRPAIRRRPGSGTGSPGCGPPAARRCRRDS